jgi:hypothetical protein
VDQTSFSCVVDTSDPCCKLGIEIWLDNDKIFDLDHVVEPVKITHEFSDQENTHELRFVLKNKQQEHTKVDTDGNIISDARLSIQNVALEEIELGHTFISQATYSHDFNGTGPSTQEQFFGEMGCNGTVSFKFSTPTYHWLLENI